MAQTRFIPPRLETEHTTVSTPPFPVAREDRPRSFRRAFIGGLPTGASPAPRGQDSSANGDGSDIPPPRFEDTIAESNETSRIEAIEHGHKEGRALAQAETSSLLERLQATVDELQRLRGNLFEGYRSEMVEIAIQVAQSITRSRTAAGEAIARPLVEEAIAELGLEEPLRLTLGEHDAESLEPWLAKLRAGGEPIVVQTDPGLQEGDIRLQCESGTVESLVEDRLKRVRELILGRELEPSNDE